MKNEAAPMTGATMIQTVHRTAATAGSSSRRNRNNAVRSRMATVIQKAQMTSKTCAFSDMMFSFFSAP
jgi:hypothetical protein